MKTGGKGGGNTITGLNFENKVDFQLLLEAVPGYTIQKIPNKAGVGVFFDGILVASFRCKTRKHTHFSAVCTSYLSN
jgi:hypothetical protein